MKFAVFASGNGTNLQRIIEAVKAGEITGELALVFSDKRKSLALKRAEEAGIPTLVLEYKDYTNKQSLERDLIIYLRRANIDFIVLAGFMRILSPYVIREYPDKILNIHPSLLPSFKGTTSVKDTLTYGCKVAGVTIHFVDDKMDHGPIILQDSVKVQEDDNLESLAEKVRQVEHKIFPKAIQLFIEGRLRIKGRKVKVLEKKNTHLGTPATIK